MSNSLIHGQLTLVVAEEKLPVPTRPSGRSTASNVTQGIYVCMWADTLPHACTYSM